LQSYLLLWIGRSKLQDWAILLEARGMIRRAFVFFCAQNPKLLLTLRQAPLLREKFSGQ
jgi:hypothetical protein